MTHQRLFQSKAASSVFIAIFWLALIFLATIASAIPAQAAEKPDWLTQAEWAFLRDHETITIAPDPDFPPIESIDNDGNYTGLAADYVRLVENMLGITFTIDRSESWDEVLRKARSRNVDVLPAAANTRQRQGYLNFSSPHLVLPGVIIVRDQVRNELALSDLYGMSVAIVSGYVWQELIEAEHEEIKVVPVADLEAGLRKVAFGSVDAMIATLPVAIHTIQRAGIPNLHVAGETGFFTRLSFATRKDWPLLNSAIGKALARITPEEKKAILKKWIGLSQHHIPIYKTKVFLVSLGAGVAVIAFVIIGVFFWNKLLRQQVLSRTAELQRSEERFKTLFDSAAVSIWNEDFSDIRRELERLRRDGVSDLRQYLEANRDAAWAMAAMVKVVRVNEATLKLFGAETEQAFIESIANVFGPGAIDVFIELLCAIWEKKEKTFRSEAAHKTLSGEQLTVIVSMPIPETEEDFRSVPVSIIDITERTRLEEAVRRSEARFRSAFENVPVGNVVIGEAGSIEIFNAAAEKIFGYTRDEVIGRNVRMLMPERYRDRHDGYIRDHLEAGDANIVCIDREVTALRKNGEEFPMHLGIAEMHEADRRSFIGSFSDLTEIKALEVRLLQSQRMEAVGQLTGGVAHDFNNLLAVMLGNAELLELRVGASEESQRHIEEIKGAVFRGSSLTQRLLAFSRQQVLSPVSVDVSTLINGLHDMLLRSLGETIDLRIETAPDLWPVTIDPHQFENALINLAVNARDAMPDGGALVIESANVTLDETYAESHEEVTQGDYVMVAVSDFGAGMPGPVLERVFEPFFTTKEVGEGTGLGLSMVYGFVKQSRGHVTIYSEVGLGTTVKLYLPRSRESVAETDTGEDTPEFAPGSERILVVEDDPDVRDIPVAILRAQGYEVAEAADGRQAIDQLKAGPPFDLLFTDIVLPGGMNGVEIAREAKRLQPDIKVIYTTGYAEHALAHNGDLDPGTTLVTKPYRRAELLEKVRAALGDGGD